MRPFANAIRKQTPRRGTRDPDELRGWGRATGAAARIRQSRSPATATARINGHRHRYRPGQAVHDESAMLGRFHRACYQHERNAPPVRRATRPPGRRTWMPASIPGAHGARPLPHACLCLLSYRLVSRGSRTGHGRCPARSDDDPGPHGLIAGPARCDREPSQSAGAAPWPAPGRAFRTADASCLGRSSRASCCPTIALAVPSGTVRSAGVLMERT